MSRQRSLSVLSATVLAACTELAPLDPQRIQRAAGSGDAASDALSPEDGQGASKEGAPGLDLGDATPAGCGNISGVGCCDGETLWWCEQGILKNLHCASRPHCGWNAAAKFNDCNTSGDSDPTGEHAKECFLVTDASLPRTDSRSDGGGDCRGVKTEGCCAGNTLLYCVDGVLRALHCGLNPSCGWLANAQFYDCGTEGLQDPKGAFKKECPIPAPDGLAFGLRDAGTLEASADLGPAGDTGGGKDGCDCTVGGPGGPSTSAFWLLALLGVLARSGRRSVPSGARSPGRSPRRRSRGAARRD